MKSISFNTNFSLEIGNRNNSLLFFPSHQKLVITSTTGTSNGISIFDSTTFKKIETFSFTNPNNDERNIFFELSRWNALSFIALKHQRLKKKGLTTYYVDFISIFRPYKLIKSVKCCGRIYQVCRINDDQYVTVSWSGAFRIYSFSQGKLVKLLKTKIPRPKYTFKTLMSSRIDPSSFYCEFEEGYAETEIIFIDPKKEENEITKTLVPKNRGEIHGMTLIYEEGSEVEYFVMATQIRIDTFKHSRGKKFYLFGDGVSTFQNVYSIPFSFNTPYLKIIYVEKGFLFVGGKESIWIFKVYFGGNEWKRIDFISDLKIHSDRISNISFLGKKRKNGTIILATSSYDCTLKVTEIFCEKEDIFSDIHDFGYMINESIQKDFLERLGLLKDLKVFSSFVCFGKPNKYIVEIKLGNKNWEIQKLFLFL